MSDQVTDNELRDILQHSKTVAVVGLSDNPARGSYEVAEYLSRHGYRILPVNPTIEAVLGLRAYRTLREITEHVDVVDIFRRSEDVGPIVEDAIAIGADAVWMQLGICNENAAQRARAAGLSVVMDHCMRAEHRRLIGERAQDAPAKP